MVLHSGIGRVLEYVKTIEHIFSFKNLSFNLFSTSNLQPKKKHMSELSVC
jgi:hypothetical protein